MLYYTIIYNTPLLSVTEWNDAIHYQEVTNSSNTLSGGYQFKQYTIRRLPIQAIHYQEVTNSSNTLTGGYQFKQYTNRRLPIQAIHYQEVTNSSNTLSGGYQFKPIHHNHLLFTHAHTDTRITSSSSPPLVTLPLEFCSVPPTLLQQVHPLPPAHPAESRAEIRGQQLLTPLGGQHQCSLWQ